MALAGCFAASAQSYSIDWFKVAGGGGASTGSVYAVAGAIGQPDAGHSSGGNYTLDGGFWGIIATVQSVGAPALMISLVSPTQVAVSWPSASTGFVLQQSLTINPGTWTTIPATNSDNGTLKSVVVPASSGNRFYRLSR
ncbi:MAG: hypothetical protein C5B50_14220 [Verrucomicrobia bacterium]|nr:MAG: hypothetical protein C5B50_14220 [Verrucomicrobiota bacterium]